jgi:hypothetical protein
MSEFVQEMYPAIAVLCFLIAVCGAYAFAFWIIRKLDK